MNEHDIQEWKAMTRQLADFLCIALAYPHLFDTDDLYEKASFIRDALGGPIEGGGMAFIEYRMRYKNGKQD